MASEWVGVGWIGGERRGTICWACVNNSGREFFSVLFEQILTMHLFEVIMWIFSRLTLVSVSCSVDNKDKELCQRHNGPEG